MMSEREFLQARFAIVREESERMEALLADSPHLVEHTHKIALRREHRLLRRLLSKAPEGQVHSMLTRWHVYCNKKLREHQRKTRAAQNDADDYWRLSWDEREEIEHRPENPSLGVQIEDLEGNVYVVDERYLQMTTRLIDQLERWLASED